MLMRTLEGGAVLMETGRSCRVCGKGFFARTSLHAYCSPKCVLKEAADQKLAEKIDRIATKRRLAELDPRRYPKAKAAAQDAFNRYIRLRDRAAGHGCICCGEPLDWYKTAKGGGVDAGHYLSRGGAPELAFHEQNVNAQRKGCNRPGGATRTEFRAGMVARWGEAVVVEIEGPHPAAKWTVDDLKAIRAKYAAKAKELEA